MCFMNWEANRVKTLIFSNKFHAYLSKFQEIFLEIGYIYISEQSTSLAKTMKNEKTKMQNDNYLKSRTVYSNNCT